MLSQNTVIKNVLLPFLFVVGFWVSADAQISNLKLLDSLVQKQYPAITKLLDHYQLETFKNNKAGKFIRFDTVEVMETGLEVFFNIPGKYNWNQFLQVCDSSYQSDFVSVFYNDVNFLIDIFEEQGYALNGLINIWLIAPDVKIVIYRTETGDIETDAIEIMGEIADTLSLSGLKVYLPSATEIKNDLIPIDTIKQKLERLLPHYFENRKQKTWSWLQWVRGESVFKCKDKRFYPPDEIKFSVKNVKGVIFKERDLWEHLDIDFYFEKREEALILRYSLRARYYEGGVFYPANFSVYSDLKEDEDALKEFRNEFNTAIKGILSN